MAIPTLSGSYIDETYGRLVQTDNFRNEFADGFGNPIPILIHNTSTGSYGSFFDTGSYMATSATTVYSMSLSTTDISNGVYISGSSNPYNTYIKFTNAGVYNIQFSAQFSNTNQNGQDVAIWLRKNDNSAVNDIPDSAGIVTIPPRKGAVNGQIIASWNYFITVAPNDFVQLLWHAPVANTITLETIAAGTNPTHPRTPAVILTANRVDQFLSNTGSFTGSFTGSLLGTAATASYISPTFISASAAASGFGSGGTNIDTSSFVTNQQTSSFVTNQQTSSFVTNQQTSSFVLNSQTGSFATTGSNNFIGNQTITGSLTVSGSSTFTNIGPAIFSGSVTSTNGFTGSFGGDGSNLTNLNIPTQVVGNSGEIQYNNGGSGFGGVSTLTYDGSSLVKATNISATGSFSGSFNGAFNYIVYEGIDLYLPLSLPDPVPFVASEVFGSTIYVVRTAIGDGINTSTVPLTFSDPSLYTGQRAIVINMDQTNAIVVDNTNSWAARNLENNPITEILKRTSKEFICTGTKWIELT